MKNRPLTTIPKKMNKNEKNSKLRVFFWLVPLPKGRCRCQAPYADASETLGLPKGSPKTAKNGQKWPKMTTRGRKLIKPSKLWYTPHYPLLKSFNLGKHLHKEPDVYIYTLAMAPAKKTPLILNSFHFYSSFFI